MARKINSGELLLRPRRSSSEGRSIERRIGTRAAFACISVWPAWPLLLMLLPACLVPSPAVALPLVEGVEIQPLQAQARRIAQALELSGQPLSEEQQSRLEASLNETDAKKALAQIQALFDPMCLVGININAESRVKVERGDAPVELIQQGWRMFLIKVHNQAGSDVQAALH